VDIKIYQNDLPNNLDLGSIIAVDTETLGLNLFRDRLCLVQLCSGDGIAHLVQCSNGAEGVYEAPNLKSVLSDSSRLKLFHFGRFDLAVLRRDLGVLATPAYCTKIASKLVRTFTDRHGLKDLCRDLLGVDISKQQQTSDWGAEVLSDEQLQYAASDVLYLHDLKHRLDAMLQRQGRSDLANSCFEFLPHRAELDLAGWDDVDIFSHS
jgi:ribonuclease D